MLLSFNINSELHSSKRRRNASNSASRVKQPPFVFRPTFFPAKIWLSLAQRVEIESDIFKINQPAHQILKGTSWFEANPPINLAEFRLQTSWSGQANRLHAVVWACEVASGNPLSFLWLVESAKPNNLIGLLRERSELRNVSWKIFVYKIYKIN